MIPVEGREPWVSAARSLLSEHELVVRKWRSNSSGRAYWIGREIEAPRPTGYKSFAVLAHEVAHKVLEHGGSGPRWKQEVEAWDWALEQFTALGLPGRRKVTRWITPRVAYAFGKAVRRGADPLTIKRTYPTWSRRVVRYEEQQLS